MAKMIEKMGSEEKLGYIFAELKKGVDREDISKELGYKTFKSMDNFVRKRGNTWDGRMNVYFLPEDRNNGQYAKTTSSTQTKVRGIISLFSQNDSDAKEIAEELGFDGHRDLAIYMKAKGYFWNDEVSNYELDPDKQTSEDDNTRDARESEVSENSRPLDSEEFIQNDSTAISDNDMNISRNYQELLDYLLEKEEVLRLLLSEKDIAESEGIIPRYAVPGIFVTKSVHMTNRLDHLVRDFSKEKNISQRELFEVALVEFFQKYGYREEIDILLEKS